ncbi:helix-turn-helix transcriptional regulator [Roseateles sp. SL47]|uniref:helix-turn-helix domain-containing protein n=1 Tax=Roseateles sp. SL47 TaxID=2995138 RepID=UPI002270BA21|nr:helix-turn-helix transcriptional regulator [Roseateles sp. SL47]WAC74001.1 helix-turn-helix transcriptional regulator [Roseateles sp. SL47]
MASTQTLIDLIKAELKTAGISYAQLARELGLSESSVKRMFAAGGEMPLSRIDELCRVLKTDFAELSQRLSQSQPLRLELSLQQEREVVADEKLLLMAICCLSQWSYEQIVATYRLSEADATRAMAHLDRLGIIALRPLNRYRLQVAKTFRWRPHGPVMQFFRDSVMQDFFNGGFDGDGELMMLVHGQLSPGMARELRDRLQRVAEDFARQHLLDQKLPDAEKRQFTLVMGMRCWLFERFAHLQRPATVTRAMTAERSYQNSQ